MKVKKVVDISHDDIPFKDIKTWYEENLAPDVINFDDQDVYKHVYHEGNWGGIFQLTSKGSQNLFKKAKPENIIDIATLTSIYRPGPLAANVDKLYVEAKNGKDYEWPDLRIGVILKSTRGLIIFQEQVMELAEKCAGFPKDECDQVRRAIMKRSISGGEAAKKKASEIRDGFVKGCIANDYTKEVANLLYDRILFFCGYGFNKCLDSETIITTTDKSGKCSFNKKLVDITSNDYVFSRDEKLKKDIVVKVVDKHNNGILELVEIELTTGEKIRCTMDHKFRTVETGEMLPVWLIQEKKYSIVRL